MEGEDLFAVFTVGISLVIWFGVSCLIAAYAEKKGYHWQGFFLFAALLSPIVAVVVVALLEDRSAAQARVTLQHEINSAVAANRDRDPLGLYKSHAGRPEGRFYYADNGNSEGPFTAHEIRDFLDAGVISEATPLVREGEAEWRSMEAYPELRAS